MFKIVTEKWSSTDEDSDPSLTAKSAKKKLSTY